MLRLIRKDSPKAKSQHTERAINSSTCLQITHAVKIRTRTSCQANVELRRYDLIRSNGTRKNALHQSELAFSAGIFWHSALNTKSGIAAPITILCECHTPTRCQRRLRFWANMLVAAVIGCVRASACLGTFRLHCERFIRYAALQCDTKQCEQSQQHESNHLFCHAMWMASLPLIALIFALIRHLNINASPTQIDTVLNRRCGLLLLLSMCQLNSWAERIGPMPSIFLPIRMTNDEKSMQYDKCNIMFIIHRYSIAIYHQIHHQQPSTCRRVEC